MIFRNKSCFLSTLILVEPTTGFLRLKYMGVDTKMMSLEIYHCKKQVMSENIILQTLLVVILKMMTYT